MSTHRRRRLDRHTAEELLCGRQAGLPADGDALARLLAAAAAPARDGELAGEEEAATAFRAVLVNPAKQQPWRPSMIKQLLTLKLAIAAGAAAAGGIALASATGHLPTQLGGSSSAAAHATAAASAAASASAAAHAPHGTPSPSMHGLCRAFMSGVSTSQGKALANPAFTALITAAGSKDKVTSFCTTLLGSSASRGAAAQATERANSSHPTGKPASAPGGGTSHPTGKPTAIP